MPSPALPLALPLRVAPSEATGGWLVWDADGRLVAECEDEAPAVALALRANSYPALVTALDRVLPYVERLARGTRPQNPELAAQLRAVAEQLLRTRAKADGA